MLTKQTFTNKNNMQKMLSKGTGFRRDVGQTSSQQQLATSGARVLSPAPKQSSAMGEQRQLRDKAGHASNYKTKSISGGRKTHKQQPSGGGAQTSPSLTPMLHSTQSMSSLQQKHYNTAQTGVSLGANAGRVLISPTNFSTVRIPGSQAQQPSSFASQQISLGQQQQRVLEQYDSSQSYAKQLRKQQISALRQIKKPAGEQQQQKLQIGTTRQYENHHANSHPHPQHRLAATATRPQQQSQPQLTGTGSGYPKLVVNDRQGSSDQVLLIQQQQQQVVIGGPTTAQQVESEYSSLGRQDQKIRFYQSRGEPHQHQMSRLAVNGAHGVSNSQKGSEENSDDFQAVAEEDMGSFIKHRDEYLDGDLMSAESLLFKQQPKPGRDPRPNPNAQISKQKLQQKRASGSTGGGGLAFQRCYSSQKQLITGSIASQLSHHSGGRKSSQNTHVPVQIEEIANQPSSQAHAHASQANPLRQQSNVINLNKGNAASSSKKSGRKVTHVQNVLQSSEQQQVTSWAGGPGPEYAKPLVRAMTTMVAPVSLVKGPQQQPQFSGKSNELLGQVAQGDQGRLVSVKCLQRVETLTSMGVAKPQYPMFPLEDNKKAQQMIQFEMNLLARASKQAVASYSLRDSNQQPGTYTLLNKATLCDSSGSKQSNSHSAFLRKSLWLLTSLKNKALKEVVTAQQAQCQACQYLRGHGVGCLVQNQSANNQHAQTFIQDQHETAGNVAVGFGLSSSILKNNVNKAQSVVTLPIEKQGSSSTQGDANDAYMGNSVHKTHKNGYFPSRHQQISMRNSQKRLVVMQTSHTGIADHTQGGSSSMQGINQLGSMGTYHLIVESFEHDFLSLLVQKTLNTKYLTSQEYYNSKIAADIMYNEQRHIVSVFKEYLIFDDFSEYLKRFYTFKEAQDRLPRVFEFYEHYSKVFPNYVSIPESKFMFKNIERKQKLIDQRHQIYMKNQATKEGKDDEGFKQSANMLFGSQFLKEVYANDENSMSRISAEIKAQEVDRRSNENLFTQLKNPPLQPMFMSPRDSRKNRLINTALMAKQDDFVSPQAKQAQTARLLSKKVGGGSQMVKQQDELDNVISMLSRFEQSRRNEESMMSMSISRSYIDGANNMGPKQNPKQTPQRMAALQSDASRKTLSLQPVVTSSGMNKFDKHLASQQNLEQIKRRTGDLFTDGWNFQEPAHDLSMSSWALTSFMKNCDDQPSGLVDTEMILPQEFQIEDFSKARTDNAKRLPAKKDSALREKKGKLFQIQTDVAMPPNTITKLSMKGSEVLSQHAAADLTSTSKHTQKMVSNRRHSVISPNNLGDISKGMQSAVLLRNALEKTGTQGQVIKTSRQEREKIKQTPQRDDKTSVKKKSTIGTKSSTCNANNNLANSRCRSKLSIGSSQTQAQQNINKKAALTSSNRKQIDKMIKDSSMKFQLDKNNRQFVQVKQRTGATSSTNMAIAKQASLGQNLATLAMSMNDPTNFMYGQTYNTSQNPTKAKTAKSNPTAQIVGGPVINTSRNVKVSLSNAVVKSNSQTAGQGAGTTNSETSQAYKSSGHDHTGAGQVSSKVFKASGYEDAKPINERFIDLNKASEGAPKISKPTLANQFLKSNEFTHLKGQTQALRLGDQSAKTHSSNKNLLANVNINAVVQTQRSNQHQIGFRKSQDTPQPIIVGNQQISQIGPSITSKLQGQAKTAQRVFENRPLSIPGGKPDLMSSDAQSNGQTIINPKSPSNQMSSQQMNLPQIIKKETGSSKEKKEAKNGFGRHEIQLKTIFKHDGQVTQVPKTTTSQQAQHYTQKKKQQQHPQPCQQQSPELTQMQIQQYSTQHAASKSHEPKERQAKQQMNLNQASLGANSVIGHNSQHCLMLVQHESSHQIMSQVGPQTTTNARKDHHGKLEGNMLIQNNILHKSSSLMQQQVVGSSHGTKASGNNPYAKTGRILNSLNAQKQSVQSLGHMSGNSAGTQSQNLKGVRNVKLNAKTTMSNHVLKGNSAQSVSSSSSIGSSKISHNSAQTKGDSSQIYLKTLSRVHAANSIQVGIGTKSSMMIRKTPSGSSSSSKTKKIKVTGQSSGFNTGTKTSKLKATTGKSSNVAQNPYPVGASHGQTIFSVTMPRQTLQATLGQGLSRLARDSLQRHP